MTVSNIRVWLIADFFFSCLSAVYHTVYNISVSAEQTQCNKQTLASDTAKCNAMVPIFEHNHRE